MGSVPLTGADTTSGLPVLFDAVAVLCLLAGSFVVMFLNPANPVRVAVTLSTLLFVPGYAITLALFPAGSEEAERSRLGLTLPLVREGRTAALDGLERAGLSFGLSVVSLPVFALFLAAVDLPADAGTILAVVAGATVPLLGVGLIRRSRTPTAIRYAPSTATVRAGFDRLARGSSFDARLNVLLVLVAVSAVATLGFALAAPQDGHGYTQVNLLREDLSGDLSASNYPTDLTRNETAEVVLSVANQERDPSGYAVVVQRQDLVSSGAVTARSEIDRFRIDTEAGATKRVRHEFQVSAVGTDQRIAYLLYRDDAPAEPTLDSAYRNVYLWVDVRPVGNDTGLNATDTSP